MHIQLLSDLHLGDDLASGSHCASGQAYVYEIPPQVEYLALLGDTGCTCDDRLFTWIDVQLSKFKVVLFLSGNHGESDITYRLQRVDNDEQSRAGLLS